MYFPPAPLPVSLPCERCHSQLLDALQRPLDPSAGRWCIRFRATKTCQNCCATICEKLASVTCHGIVTRHLWLEDHVYSKINGTLAAQNARPAKQLLQTHAMAVQTVIQEHFSGGSLRDVAMVCLCGGAFTSGTAGPGCLRALGCCLFARPQRSCASHEYFPAGKEAALASLQMPYAGCWDSISLSLSHARSAMLDMILATNWQESPSSFAAPAPPEQPTGPSMLAPLQPETSPDVPIGMSAVTAFAAWLPPHATPMPCGGGSSIHVTAAAVRDGSAWLTTGIGAPTTFRASAPPICLIPSLQDSFRIQRANIAAGLAGPTVWNVSSPRSQDNVMHASFELLAKSRWLCRSAMDALDLAMTSRQQDCFENAFWSSCYTWLGRARDSLHGPASKTSWRGALAIQLAMQRAFSPGSTEWCDQCVWQMGFPRRFRAVLALIPMRPSTHCTTCVGTHPHAAPSSRDTGLTADQSLLTSSPPSIPTVTSGPPPAGPSPPLLLGPPGLDTASLLPSWSPPLVSHSSIESLGQPFLPHAFQLQMGERTVTCLRTTDASSGMAVNELGAVAIGPVTGNVVVYGDHEINAAVAIQERVVNKARPCQLTQHDYKKIGSVVRALITDVFNKDNVKRWLDTLEGDYSFSTLRSPQWTEERFQRARLSAMTDSMDLQPSTAVKREVLPRLNPLKAPRHLTADGDLSVLVALPSIACIESLLFEHFEKRNIKHMDAKLGVAKVVKHLAEAWTSEQSAVLESDGSCWDASVTRDISRAIEDPIINAVQDHLVALKILPEWWAVAHEKLNKQTQLIHRVGRMQHKDKAYTWGTMRDHVLAVLPAYRRSGARGTSVLNWICNFCLWSAALFHNPSISVRQPGVIIGRLSTANARSTAKVAMGFEGDDTGIGMSWWNDVIEKHCLAFWERAGFNMKFKLRRAGQAFEFCGWWTLVGPTGPDHTQSSPDVRRNLSVGAWSSSTEALAAVRSSDWPRLAAVIRGANIARSMSFAGRVPLLSWYYWACATAVGDGPIFYDKQDHFMAAGPTGLPPTMADAWQTLAVLAIENPSAHKLLAAMGLDVTADAAAMHLASFASLTLDASVHLPASWLPAPSRVSVPGTPFLTELESLAPTVEEQHPRVGKGRLRKLGERPLNVKKWQKRPQHVEAGRPQTG